MSFCFFNRAIPGLRCLQFSIRRTCIPSFMFLAKVETHSLNMACSFSGSRVDSYAIGAIHDGAEPWGDRYSKDLHAIRSIALWKI